jgi:hypothetical protein
MLAMFDPPLTTCVLDPGGVIGGSWYGGVGDIGIPLVG